MCMRLDQRIHLKVWCAHGLPFTDHCNLEFKVFSWGEVISVSLQRSNSSLQTLAFIAHLATVVRGASGVAPTSKGCAEPQTQFCNEQWVYSTRQVLSCSVWKAAPANVCALCATTILGLVQVCELQSWWVLDWLVCMDIAASFSFVLFLLLPLSLCLSGLSHLMMGEQGKSFHFFFVSVTDHERDLSLLLFWARLCIIKATKLIECQSSHLHFCLCVSWAKASCQPRTQMARREHEMISW